jgi:hypothetical protein
MFFGKKERKTVSFATSCWKRDWKQVLLDEDYLKNKLIGNHSFDFDEKILIINNVDNIEEVLGYAKKQVNRNNLTHVYSSQKNAQDILDFFNLKKESFCPDNNEKFEIVNQDWIYYNALAPLSSIYYAKSDYLLYVTADVHMEKAVSWIDKAIELLEKKKMYKVANPLWNDKYEEAKKESYRTKKDFFVAKSGFSDQCFLVNLKEFKRPIYSEVRKDSFHYPRGDVFEKRVYSFMKNRKWKRITYKLGSYTHENFS